MNKQPELILPAGDAEKARFTLEYGADAVYLGLPKYSMRKGEVRFTIPQIEKVIRDAHKKGKRVYVTFNIFAHEKHLKTLASDIKKIAKLNPDAFVVADMGVLRIIKENAPKVPIHISTQQNTVNAEAVKLWKDFGVKRVILARELTLKEIKKIHESVPDMELEMFVHGAMCISYSGRCLLSAYMTGREANLGDCAQPCRWEYKIKCKNEKVKSTNAIPDPSSVIPAKAGIQKKEIKNIDSRLHGNDINEKKGSLHSSPCEVGRDDTFSVIPTEAEEPLEKRRRNSSPCKASRDNTSPVIPASPSVIPTKAGIYLEEKLRPGEYFPIEEDENGTYIMNSKDLCLIGYLDKVLDAGITGLKVEGRNKSIYYLGIVAKAYRKALDTINNNIFNGKIIKELEKELRTLNYRGYTTGFAFGKAKEGETYPKRQPIRKYNFVAVVRPTPKRHSTPSPCHSRPSSVIPAEAEEPLKKQVGKGSLHPSPCEADRDDTFSVIPTEAEEPLEKRRRNSSPCKASRDNTSPVIPASPSVIPDAPSVIPASPSVIPAKAGIYNIQQAKSEKNPDPRIPAQTTIRSSRKLEDDNWNYIEVRNQIKVGDTLEIITPERVSKEKVLGITDESGRKITVVNPGRKDQKAYLRLKNTYPEMTLMRKRVAK